MENQTRHKRRIHYSGTHPRRFEEKYKELDPERYAEDVEHVKRRGATPAGMHISIMVQEILDFLQIQPGEIGLDATLGYGGHSGHMLEQLQGKGHLYALDVDPIESAKTEKRLADRGFGPEILTVCLRNFRDIDQVSLEAGKKFDFILADLGVSSMQIDNPERGFSFKVEGPLDLRLNPQKGISAAQRLLEVDQQELEGMLIENSDEPYAAEIAAAVVSARDRGQSIETTLQLREIIEEALQFLPKKDQKQEIKKACQRVFQALRIDINCEFEVLFEFLDKLPQVLAPNGRVAILTFHSGEDRMVKQAFKRHFRDGFYSDIARDVIRPGSEECFRNPRAKSTKMRWAVRSAD